MGGGGGMKVSDGGDYNTYRYTVTTSDSCIKMGSDGSYSIVSLIVRDKVTRQCPRITTFFFFLFFFKRKESRSGIEPRPFRLPA